MRLCQPPEPWCNRLVQQSLKIVEASQDRVDRSLIAWVALAQITQDTRMLLYAIDRSRKNIIQQFQQRLREWPASCPQDIVDG